ncbi:hypothetical protein [uncultured Sphingomonas sp.]|nr:hypothetical protein [uncultured Sphingomonas sp.]
MAQRGSRLVSGVTVKNMMAAPGAGMMPDIIGLAHARWRAAEV